jgi:hypothetical protein
LSTYLACSRAAASIAPSCRSMFTSSCVYCVRLAWAAQSSCSFASKHARLLRLPPVSVPGTGAVDSARIKHVNVKGDK